MFVNHVIYKKIFWVEYHLQLNSIHPIQLLSKGKLIRVIIRICHTDNFRFHIEDVCKSIIKETKGIIRNEYIDTGNNDEFDDYETMYQCSIEDIRQEILALKQLEC